jgi:hypothetical protein
VEVLIYLSVPCSTVLSTYPQRELVYSSVTRYDNIKTVSYSPTQRSVVCCYTSINHALAVRYISRMLLLQSRRNNASGPLRLTTSVVLPKRVLKCSVEPVSAA